MIEIKKIYKKDIPSLINNQEIWNNSFIVISKHRLLAHSKNPNLEENDIVLLLAYSENELVGYMGIFIDKVLINNIEQKIGWLSTWWVHPKTKGSGIGREILNMMYAENNGKIGISQFTPSAKRVYDKSEYFTSLKENIGVKAVLRSNLTFVIPAIFPKLKGFNSILNLVDNSLNCIINLKLAIQKSFISSRLKGIAIEYLSAIDQETKTIIEKYNTNDISKKSIEFYEWLKANNWVQKAPLLKFTNYNDYEFSIYDNEFEIHLMKIIQNKICIGFIVLQKRNFVSKVLFTYFDDQKHANIISDVIKLQNIS